MTSEPYLHVNGGDLVNQIEGHGVHEEGRRIGNFVKVEERLIDVIGAIGLKEKRTSRRVHWK